MSDEEGGGDVGEEGTVTKTQMALQKLIEKQLRMTRRTGKYIEKLKEKFKTDYDRDFVEGEGKILPLTASLSVPRIKIYTYNEILPQGTRCCVCRSNTAKNFSLNMQLCGNCKYLSKRLGITAVTCTGILQELDKCIPDYRYITCVKCALTEINRMLPNYYNGNNLQSSADRIPERAKEGGSGYLMDLGKDAFYKTLGDDDRVSKFNSDNLPVGAETVAILVRAMDFGVENKRCLMNFLLRVQLSDPRRETSYGLQQIIVVVSKSFRGFNESNSGIINGSLVYVDMDLIEWFPWENGWNNIAAIEFACFTLTDYLLNPLLNNHPSQDKNEGQTIIVNQRMEVEFFKDHKFVGRLSHFLNKRGCQAIEWKKSKAPLEATDFPRSTPTSRGRKRRNSNLSDVPTSPKKFGGVIYGKFSKNGITYIGDNTSFLTPRRHDISCPCSWCVYFDDHDEEDYISVVLYYFEKKEDSHHYEGMMQTVFALAEAYGMKLSDLKLPFPVKTENYQKTWPEFDPASAKFPEVKINLINTFIHGRRLTFSQYTEFLNMFKVLFNSELILDYKWHKDYLSFRDNK